MKKLMAWLLVLALTATVSIGATLAYLTDTDEDVNVMTLGKVKIEQLEYERVDTETEDANATVQEFHDNKPLFPSVVDKSFDWTTGDSFVDWEQIGKDGYTSEIWNPENINNELDKMVFIRNKGDYDAYVRSVFAFEAGSDWDFAEFQKKVHLNVNTDTDVVVWDWLETPVTIGEGTYFIATATYVDSLKAGQISDISLAQIALDPSVTNEDMAVLGDTYHVLVKSQGIQADGFADAKTALNEGFKPIDTANIPWDSDQPVQGTSLANALRFYQGDLTQPIHDKVSKVVFGLTKEHANIAENYDGTLVSDEQDVEVYTYYVPDGSNYIVYFLSNSKIYAPKDSSNLFKQMKAMTTVDTSNLDVSRVENMFGMFESAESLTTIDVTNWDTSNVTTMEQLFYMCYNLDGIDVSNWNISNVTNLHRAFNQCQHLSYLDLSKWDVRNVTTTAKMFYNDFRLTEIVGLGNWKTESLTACNSMFSSGTSNVGNMLFTHLDVENWDVSKCTNMGYMFYGCGNLTELDLSKWNTSKNTTFNHFFADCFKLARLDFTGWDTSSVKIFGAMFNDCYSLTELDLSDFDLGSATNLDQMFEGTAGVKTIKGMEKWDTSNVVSFYELFNNNGKSMQLEYVDMSSFDTSKVTSTYCMFNGCTKLKTVYVGDGWDMDQVTSSGAMFGSCSSLTGANGTTTAGNPGDKTYARVDTPEIKDAEGNVLQEAVPGYLTYKPTNG